VICFGRNSTFRYYDQKTKAILTQIKEQNGKKLSMYTSLPILPVNDLVLQKKLSAKNGVEPKYGKNFCFL
jgi:hypothetical protein